MKRRTVGNPHEVGLERLCACGGVTGLRVNLLRSEHVAEQRGETKAPRGGDGKQRHLQLVQRDG
eukprot:4216765-Prymnesium_polylepis.2